LPPLFGLEQDAGRIGDAVDRVEQADDTVSIRSIDTRAGVGVRRMQIGDD
jgi:hypothetical protein